MMTLARSLRYAALTVVCAGLVFSSAGYRGFAQDLRKVEPQPAPKLTPPVAPITNTMSEAEFFRGGATTNEPVIIKELKGVVFIPDQSEVKSGPFVGRPGMDATRVPMLQTNGLEILAKAFIGQPASQESLDRMTRSVRIFLGQLGYPFVAAYLPPQDVTDGYVQMVVKLSVAAEDVKVEGAKYFRESAYQSQIRQKAGEPINVAELREDVDWLNRNSFRSTTIATERGPTPGTTRLVLRTQERLPIRVYTGYNNTGTQTSGEDRVFAGFNWGNAFWAGHQMNYQFTASTDFETSLSHSGQYAFDLPWRHTVRFIGAFSDLKARVAPPLTMRGESWQVGMRYEIPLPRLMKGRFTHQLSLGWDFKASDNNLDFGPIPVTDNLTHISHAVISYDFGLTDKWGRTDISFFANASPGRMTENNDDPFFGTSRAGASPRYLYGGVDLNRQTRLPWKFSWNKRARLQLASDNLLGSEQFGGGGAGSVRGYEEGEVYGDNGLLISHEIGFPMFRPLVKAGLKPANDGITFFAFQDYAWLSNVDRLPGELSQIEMHSLGLGFRYQVRNNLSANIAYGWQLLDTGSSRSGDNARLHAAVQLSF